MEESNHEYANIWLALVVVVIGTFMSVLDSSIVNIALPKMMSVFGMPMDKAKWIITAYTLTLGAIIPLTGYLQDIFGAKKVYIFALGMFSLGSLLCGVAWSGTAMIAFRIFQALGGGMIMPVGMSIIYQIFPKEKIGFALGLWGIAAMAAPTIGPTLGGLIIEKMDWRLIFNINVPIGIIGVILAAILLKDKRKIVFKSFDIIGFLSSTIGMVSILYVLGEGSSIDWGKVENPILMTLGVLSFVLFIVNELTHPNPLLELRIFKSFDFSMSLVINSILTLAIMGGSYILPLFLQNVRGYTPMETGLIMLPSALVMGFLMPVSGSLFDKFGAKPLVISGLVILGISSYELASAVNMYSSKSSIILITCIRSIGLGLAAMPITTAGMNAVKREFVAGASALNNTIRQVAGSLSVTIMSTLMQGKTDYSFARLTEQINVYNKASNDMLSRLTSLFMHSGIAPDTAKASAFSKLAQMIQGQATLDGMAYAITGTVVAVAAALIFTFFMRSKNNYEGGKN
ncbi:DHA2 family efflux MFS transporter permease subunit [Desulfosporosinus sp. OT]|uniref:DHA2 family efflux MFS transporter permease subunit n=1 Tax=Desulfosporosinus sp. OT TaxID=913865 RepID=UPI0002239DE6|nr:DHA2 family efflux MFS transporter permease subunit [Desulfosporosinus sp. OT]EGW40885.1 drug resistance MFS transporter, drug:H+ antiporter-1 family protein [Desulfosporosinus sp. OT]